MFEKDRRLIAALAFSPKSVYTVREHHFPKGGPVMSLTALSVLLSLALLALDQWVKRYITLTLPLGET